MDRLEQLIANILGDIKNKNWHSSFDKLSQCYLLDSSNLLIPFLEGTIYEIVENYSEAKEIFKEITDKTDNTFFKYKLGEVYFKKKFYPVSENLVNQVIKEDPELVLAQRLKGLITFYKTQDINEKIKSIENEADFIKQNDYKLNLIEHLNELYNLKDKTLRASLEQLKKAQKEIKIKKKNNLFSIGEKEIIKSAKNEKQTEKIFKNIEEIYMEEIYFIKSQIYHQLGNRYQSINNFLKGTISETIRDLKYYLDYSKELFKFARKTIKRKLEIY